MREILFRGKCVETGKWYEGQYIHLHKTTYCFVGNKQRDAENEIHQIVFEQMTDWNLPNRHLRADVSPETVGQFTGLTDKNGKKIFEGDIVTLQLVGIKETGCIKWSDSDCRFKFASPDGIAYGIDCTDIFVVIGNIHDNPELLGGGE